MTTVVERQAANLSRTGDTFQRDSVTSAEVCAVPAAWATKFVAFTAMGADVYIRFGSADTVSVSRTTASARGGTTKVLTATTAGPHLIIPAGTTVHERVDSGWTYFAHIASATGGYLYMTLATGDEP